MPIAPNTDNYTLGKGVVSFDQKNPSTGLYSGERDLGNAPAFSFNIALEKLEHFSSRGGLKAKDKEIISQITPGVTFTLDEINKENMGLLTLGDVVAVVQPAGSVSAVAYVAHPGKRISLAHRMIGNTMMAISAQSDAMTVGETVTGGTSGATAIVVSDSATALIVDNVVGTFTVGETITGGTSAETATVAAPPTHQRGFAIVQDETDTTTYVAGTDYLIDENLKDGKIGRILVLEGGAIADGDILHISYDYATATYTEIRAFANTQIEGRLRFVSDNPAGQQTELEIWRCSLAPSGDTAMIGDDWSTLGFTGEILKDEVGHPDSPYMTFIME